MCAPLRSMVSNSWLGSVSKPQNSAPSSGPGGKARPINMA
jgi:hypothetical protein